MWDYIKGWIALALVYLGYAVLCGLILLLPVVGVVALVYLIFLMLF